MDNAGNQADQANQGAGANPPAATAKEKIPPEVVKMEDGKVLEFAGKKRVMQEVIKADESGIVVKANFRNGRVVITELAPGLLYQAAAHGVKQKQGDEIANEKDLDDAILAYEELRDRLQKGEWNATMDAANSMAGTSSLLKAIVEVTGKSVAVVKEFLKGKTRDQKDALKGAPRFAAVFQRIESEKKSKQKDAEPVDTGALNAELDALA